MSTSSTNVACDAPTVPVVEGLGVRFSNLAFDEAVARILELAAGQTPRYAVTPNVDHIVRLRRDAQLRQAYDEADLTLCDGVPVLWAMRRLGRPLKEKVSGADLVPALCAAAAARGTRVFFLGAAPGVARECAERMAGQHPGLVVAGSFSPPMRFDENPETCAAVTGIVRVARPELLLVALGTPRQELFIHRRRHELGAAMSIGVGAAFDFIAGHARRAPRWMRDRGLEWLWRLAHEPGRLSRRYLIDDPAFFWIVWRERRRLRL